MEILTTDITSLILTMAKAEQGAFGSVKRAKWKGKQ